MDFGESVKVELPRFADGSDSGCARMRGIKHERGFLAGEAVRGAALGEAEFGAVKIEWRCQEGGWPCESSIQGTLWFIPRLFQSSHALGNRAVSLKKEGLTPGEKVRFPAHKE